MSDWLGKCQEWWLWLDQYLEEWIEFSRELDRLHPELVFVVLFEY